MTGRIALQDPSSASGIFIEQAYAAPDWATGYISHLDARFLYDLFAEIRPERMIEIGVASGVSTAFLLRLIQQFGLGTQLFSFDIVERFYADPSRRAAAFVTEQFDPIPTALRLSLGVSSMGVVDRLGPENTGLVDLAFIDANHRHPWPCLDLIAILPAMRPDAWIILHDVNLPSIKPELEASGPHYLFRDWPGEKRAFAMPEGIANTGAIRLLPTLLETIDALLAISKIDWEAPVDQLTFGQLWKVLQTAGDEQVQTMRSLFARNVGMAERLDFFARRVKRSLKRRLGLPA